MNSVFKRFLCRLSIAALVSFGIGALGLLNASQYSGGSTGLLDIWPVVTFAIFFWAFAVLFQESTAEPQSDDGIDSEIGQYKPLYNPQELQEKFEQRKVDNNPGSTAD